MASADLSVPAAALTPSLSRVKFASHPTGRWFHCVSPPGFPIFSGQIVEVTMPRSGRNAPSSKLIGDWLPAAECRRFVAVVLDVAADGVVCLRARFETRRRGQAPFARSRRSCEGVIATVASSARATSQSREGWQRPGPASRMLVCPQLQEMAPIFIRQLRVRSRDGAGLACRRAGWYASLRCQRKYRPCPHPNRRLRTPSVRFCAGHSAQGCRRTNERPLGLPCSRRSLLRVTSRPLP